MLSRVACTSTLTGRRGFATLPSAAFIKESSHELLAAVKKAKGDVYGPIQVVNNWNIASRRIPNFNHLLTHPMVSTEARTDFIKSLAEHLKADAPTVAFLQKVSTQDQWAALNETMALYKVLAANDRKESIAVVTSAAPLSKDEVTQITKSLEKHVQKGFKVVVETVVNPEILGGIKIAMGNMHQDLSLATALTGFETQLEKSI